MVLYGVLRVLWLESVGLTLVSAIFLASGIALFATAGRFLNRTAIVSMTKDALSFRSGMGIFRTAPKTILLERIHTVKVVGSNALTDGKLRPSALIVVYNAPARKMLHAEESIPLAGIPDGLELLLDLVQRTGAKIRISHNNLDGEPVSLEELQKRLGMQRPGKSS